jgi:hypothetical protein
MNKTNEQYKYANNIIIIFGFQNITDYTTVVSYTHLKNNTKKICENVNGTMLEFKKLFNLKKFDLARIDYNFTTLNQVYSFFKKLLSELSIPYEIYKQKQQNYLRLIQTNILYINNIMNMSDIGNPINSRQFLLGSPNSNDCDLNIANISNNMSQIKIHKLSEIVEKYGKKPITKEFLSTDTFNLSKLDYIFDCITEIDIDVYDKNLNNENNTKLLYSVTLSWFVNEIFYEKTVNLQNNCLIDKTLIPIYFCKYQHFYLSCKHATNTLFKVKITGLKFKSTIPLYYHNDKILVDVFNTTKTEKNELFTSHGMLGFKYSTATVNEVIEDIKKEEMTDYFNKDNYYCKNLNYYKKNNKISERMLKICDNDVLITTINNTIDDITNVVNKYYIDLLYFNILSKYAEHNRSFLSENTITKNYGLEVNVFCNSSKYDYSMINNNLIKLVYTIDRQADLMTKIIINNNFTKCYDMKININFDNNNIYENNISTSKLLPIIFDEPIKLINKLCKNIYLTIEIPIEHINEWSFLTYELTHIYLPNNIRSILADN